MQMALLIDNIIVYVDEGFNHGLVKIVRIICNIAIMYHEVNLLIKEFPDIE